MVRATSHGKGPGIAKVAVAPTIPLESTSPSPYVSVQPTPSPSLDPPAADSSSAAGEGSLPALPDHQRVPTAAASATECVGPLPSGHVAEPKCDVGKHHGLPPGCRWDGSCAWWDSWGAVTGGPADVRINVTPAGDLDVSWVVSSQDLQGTRYSGPIKEFVVLVHDDDTDTVVRKFELGLDNRSTTISGLGPDTYTVCVYELNDSGLGGLCPGAVTIEPPPSSPPPSDTPTPSPSPTSTS